VRGACVRTVDLFLRVFDFFFACDGSLAAETRLE
jgi:hypothetical protein